MTKYQKFIAISFCFFCISTSQAQTEKTISIPSSNSFNQDVEQIQKCYMNNEIECGNKNIAYLYTSDNPENYWQTVTKNSSSHSTRLPELPSTINYSAPQTQTTTQPTTTPIVNAPLANNNSLFPSKDNTGSTGFFVS